MPFPKLTPKTFASIRELTGISARTMEEHYELYKGYVGKTNEIQEKLTSVDRASANQIYSDLRSLRTDLSFATGGVKNHELYFAHLGGSGGAPKPKLDGKRSLLQLIEELAKKKDTSHIHIRRDGVSLKLGKSARGETSA